MDDKPKERGSGTVVLILVAVIVLLPILYVLSIGPVLWLGYHGWIGESPAIETAYTPLYWTVDNIPVAGRAITWYMRWWVPRRPSPTPTAGP